jgi:glyceraldehyde-3-phosphate dehydrogenase/erythrose-4-phosphate dehydrogenase
MAIRVDSKVHDRIGRRTLRAIYVAGLRNEFDLVAVNAAADLRSNAT